MSISVGDLFRAAVYGGAVADCADCRAASAETEGAVYAAGACTRGDDREARADPGVCGDLASGDGLFADNVVFFLFDVLTIALSGLLGVAAVSRAQEEGIFTKYHAERLGIFQFIFCVDVVASMISYCRLRRAEKSAG